MYADGCELIEIMEECHLNSEDEVLEDIRSFKELSKIARGEKRFTFNTDFKEVLIERFQSGSSVYKLSQELALSTSTISKYLKDAGINTSRDNKTYAVIKNWDDFECCPTCERENTVRHLGLHNQDEANGEKPTHSFCSACNTEWYQETIGHDEEGNPCYETRKVLWYAVK